MALLAGASLDTAKLFKAPFPQKRGSSVNLTIGHIIDGCGKTAEDPYQLMPGHMVTVISAESFELPSNVTGHVTYKTSMTREGIWALTVGIVDPGWDGPVATTLLNFSNGSHSICKGDTFLRVSFFDHDSVQLNSDSKSRGYDEYVKYSRKLAVKFPPTFLDHSKITRDASNEALRRMAFWATLWVALVGLILAGGSWFVNRDTMVTASSEFVRMKEGLVDAEARLTALEQERAFMSRDVEALKSVNKPK